MTYFFPSIVPLDDIVSRLLEKTVDRWLDGDRSIDLRVGSRSISTDLDQLSVFVVDSHPLANFGSYGGLIVIEQLLLQSTQTSQDIDGRIMTAVGQ